MIDQITKSFYIFFPLITLIVGWFYFSHQKTKVSNTKKLNLLHLELIFEKNKANQLKSVPKKVQELDNITHKKLQKIKVDIINIHFSLSKIL